MIGVFDSGYGGLTILEQIRSLNPEYDYLYLGDNARSPYGTRSYETVYHYTRQAVQWLYEQGCSLVILACNTASAKALRTIQQRDIDPSVLRVLGVIRPTVEQVPALTHTGHVGVLATPGTVGSQSYVIELQKQWEMANIRNLPLHITQQACPLWVPLIEAGEYQTEGAWWFIRKYVNDLIAQDEQIDTILLACTHYPLIYSQIRTVLRELGRDDINVVSQGEIVAKSLQHYLTRHPEIECRLQKNGVCHYTTTESAEKFADSASLFLSQHICAKQVELPLI